MDCKIKKMNIIIVLIFSLILSSCGPIQSARLEDMETGERKFLLETKTDEQLCRAFLNYYIKPLSERQIALILSKRGVKKCGTGSDIRLIPNQNDDFTYPVIKKAKIPDAPSSKIDKIESEKTPIDATKIINTPTKEEKKIELQKSVPEKVDIIKESKNISLPVESLIKKQSTEEKNKYILSKSTAQKAVLDILKDPDSAKFGELTQVTDDSACFTINAKNAFGGYTGQQQALLIRTDSKWVAAGILKDISHDMCVAIQLKK
jgi:hypothetical protein